MSSAKDKPTPAIRVSESPFGEFTEEQLAGDPGAPDRFFLKGYSDKRHQRDLDMKEGKTPHALDYRFQFVSVELNGKPNREKEIEFRRLGYKPVQASEAASYGITLDESTAHTAPDGTVHVGTQLLMVVDKKTAARHYRDQRQRTNDQQASVKESLDEAGRNYNRTANRDERTGTKFESTEQVWEE
jgi:hypothetical protein